MPNYQIEMLWVCNSCKHNNRGRDKKCKGCGKAIENEEYLMPDDQSLNNAVTDSEMLKDAIAGADWHCIYCNSSQKKRNGCCAECGAAQDKSLSVPKSSNNISKQITFDNNYNIADDEYYKKLSNKKSYLKHIFIFASIVFVLLLGGYFIFRTRIYEAQIDSVEWKHSVNIERYQIWNKEGWIVPPNAIQIQPLGQRISHYNHVLDHYNTVPYTVQVACGQTCTQIPQTCYTTSRICTSSKNGYASCSGGDRVCSGGGQSCTTRYCSESRTRQEAVYREDPIYEMWYAYKIWDWGFNRTAEKAGYTLETIWPNNEELHIGKNLNAGEQERESNRKEIYIVNFKYKDKNFKYEPTSETEFKTYTRNKIYKIKYSIAGGVTIIR